MSSWFSKGTLNNLNSDLLINISIFRFQTFIFKFSILFLWIFIYHNLDFITFALPFECTFFLFSVLLLFIVLGIDSYQFHCSRSLFLFRSLLMIIRLILELITFPTIWLLWNVTCKCLYFPILCFPAYREHVTIILWLHYSLLQNALCFMNFHLLRLYPVSQIIKIDGCQKSCQPWLINRIFFIITSFTLFT